MAEDNMENMQEICDKLCEALKLTVRFHDLKWLIYEEKTPKYQIVTAIFENGNDTPINVSLDSGFAMIFDIVDKLR